MTKPTSHSNFKVGLTGGIGVGKTTVSNAFAKLGAHIIDTDIIAREIVQPGESAYHDIIHTFGSSVLNLDNTINRAALRDMVFNHPESRLQLEKITHPRIIERMRSEAKDSTAPYCILCIPLLFETKLEQEVDRILVIDVPEELQLRRVIKRDGITEAQARSIINTQIDRQTRLTQADDIIENTGDLDDLNTRVAELHAIYQTLSA